jgi:hypothetical protein
MTSLLLDQIADPAVALCPLVDRSVVWLRPRWRPISTTVSWPARYSRSIASQSTLLRSVISWSLDGGAARPA